MDSVRLDIPDVVRLAAVDSTNAEALRQAEASEARSLWIVAGEQSSGRGRAGRAWTSKPGNLYASLLLRPGCEAGQIYQLALVAGVAVMDAIEQASSVASGDRSAAAGLRLKWPNDIMIRRAKLGGILCESRLAANAGEHIAVIGIGINLAHHPLDLGREATDLATLGMQLPVDALLSYLTFNMQYWIQLWRRGQNFAAVREAWLERSGPIGAPMTVNTGHGPNAGAFAGLADNGALLLRDTDGAVVQYSFGDVALMPRANET